MPQTRRRQVFDERLPDGRSVAEALAALTGGLGAPTPRTDEFAPFPGVLPAGTYMGDAPALRPTAPPAVPTAPIRPLANLPIPATGPDPAIPEARPPLYSGERTEGLSELGKLMLRRKILQDPANINGRVYDTAEGIEVAPGHPMSRKRGALMGALQGALAGGVSGQGLWGMVGGAGTGAAVGAINPKLVRALERQQEVERVNRDIGEQQQLELGTAKIVGTQAEAQYNTLRPYIEQARIEEAQRHNIEGETTAQSRAATALKDNEIRGRTLEETTRHNRAIESKGGPIVSRVLNGQILERDPTTGNWTPGKGSPPAVDKAAVRAEEKSTERRAKESQASKLYDRAIQYQDQAQSKRDDAARLESTPSGRIQEKANIATLIREAEKLESQAASLQTEGDKVTAQAESIPAAAGAAKSSGTFDLRRWKADHPDADTAPIIKKAKARGLRIIE